MRIIGWFQVVVGSGILLLWPVLVVAGEVPELAAGQADIWFHMVAEAVAGVLLIAAGWLLVRYGGQRAHMLSALALGALVYTGINSAGHYAELGQWALASILVLLAATAGGAFAVLVRTDAVATGRVAAPAPRTDSSVR
jgi:hypothetical protein